MALRNRVIHHPLDFALRQEGQQIDAVAEAVGRFDGICEQFAGVVEFELVDVADIADGASGTRWKKK